jgi:rhodanese-related sulfurtransferase
VSYAADLTPTDAYRLLVDDPQAVLVDVRTGAEWAYVGVPDLTGIGKTLVKIEWVSFPDGTPNAGFVDQLAATGVRPEQPVLFLCRSGVRSIGAATAATAAGYGRAYNITEGFEGNLDDAGHRGGSGGWKASGLPWRQS